MKLMVIGHAQHGKDTFAEALGIPYLSSSRVALDTFLFASLADLGHRYHSPEEAYEDRVYLRSLWFDEIARFNRNDPTRLMQKIFARSPIYVGCRSRREFRAGREQGLFDLAIWVQNSRREEESGASMELNSHDADLIVLNNGDIDQLKTKAHRISNLILKGHTGCSTSK